MTALFINTRPKNKHDIHLPVTTVHLPLLTIHRFDELSQQETQDLSDFINGRFTMLIVVSVEAASCAIEFLKKHHIHHAQDLPYCDALTVIAVGQPTAKTLRDFGFWVITPLDVGCEMSNEGMLAMPIVAGLDTNDRVLIWRGVGGRRLLHDELTSRNVSVRAIAFYERRTPINLKRDLTCLLDRLSLDSPDCDKVDYAPIFVLITSQISLNAWQDVYDAWLNDRASSHGLLPQNMIYLTLGRRLGTLTATHYPNNLVRVLADLTQDTLNQTVQSFMIHK